MDKLPKTTLALLRVVADAGEREEYEAAAIVAQAAANTISTGSSYGGGALQNVKGALQQLAYSLQQLVEERKWKSLPIPPVGSGG